VLLADGNPKCEVLLNCFQWQFERFAGGFSRQIVDAVIFVEGFFDQFSLPFIR
jgi:hypothetical protein